MFCQVSTCQNDGRDETLFTCTTSEKKTLSVLVYEHLNVSFGKLFFQITTSQNVDENETLLTIHK